MKTNHSLKTILLTGILMITGYYASAQEINSLSISGKVTSTDGEILSGVNIIAEGTNTGTISDINGNYVIDVPEGTEYLTFSYLGYISERMTIEGKTTINVVLLPDLVALSEIVVVGYGVQKKSLVTGSISKISSDEITRTQNLRVEEALQGKVSGVSISPNSGQPGQNLNVLIRGIGSNGNTEPLYIIDGLKVGADGMNSINPGDIESIEILKDAASAAIYGTQAANGVILITTKKGKHGEKGTFSYNGYWGISDAAVYPDLMNAKEYATYMREGYALEEIGLDNRNIDDADVQTYVDSRFPYHPDTLSDGTDWVSEIVNPASQQSHSLSFSTGTDKSTLYISGSYYKQNGIIGDDRSTFERYTFSMNNTTIINDWITVHGKIDYSNKLQKTIPENDEFEGIMTLAVNMDPITPVLFNDTSELTTAQKNNLPDMMKDEEGRYYAISDLVSGDICNPFALMETRNNYRKTGSVRGRLSADFNVHKNLVYTPAINFEAYNGLYSQWRPEFYLNVTRTSIRSEIVKSMERGIDYILEHTLRYDKTMNDDHTMSFLIGNSYEKYEWYGTSAQKFDLRYLNDDFAYLSSASNAGTDPSDGVWENVLISYFGRVNYNWKEKILITLNYRADGSMKFGTDNRFGYFPSVSLGYIPTRETWWSFPAINFLKIRGSWGRNGSNANLGSYDYISIIDFGYYGGRYPSSNDQILDGAKPSRVANPKLKWETSEQIDIGMDVGLFSNKLFITADYYVKDQKDFLAQATVPLYVGNPSPIINAGTIRNSGVELDLKYLNTLGELNYSISASATYLRNKVLDMPDNVIPYEGVSVGSGTSVGIVNRFEVGEPVWYFWGYETDGFFNSAEEILNYRHDTTLLQPDAIPGDVRFVDRNNDGVIDEEDKTMLGKPLPTWTYGLNISLSYKMFDFSALLTAATGNSVYNASVRRGQGKNNRTTKFFEDRWLPDNTDASWFRPTVIDDNNNFRESDLFVEDASYLKLRNIQLGITLPSKITRRLHIEELRVYISGSNLLTLTSYTGGDPEIGRTPGLQNTSGQQWKSIGIDRGFYSTAKTYLCGISVTF